MKKMFVTAVVCATLGFGLVGIADEHEGHDHPGDEPGGHSKLEHKEHHEKMKAERKEHRQEMQGKRKEHREKMRGERKEHHEKMKAKRQAHRQERKAKKDAAMEKGAADGMPNDMSTETAPAN